MSQWLQWLSLSVTLLDIDRRRYLIIPSQVLPTVEDCRDGLPLRNNDDDVDDDDDGGGGGGGVPHRAQQCEFSKSQDLVER